MSHAPQVATVDRPVTAARSAPARALSPSAERYAPVVRIAVLRAVRSRPEWPRCVPGIELRRCECRQLIIFLGTMLVAQLDFVDPEFPVSLVGKAEPTLP